MMHHQGVHFFEVRGKTFAYDVHTTACVEVDRLGLTLLPEILAGRRKGLEQKYALLFPSRELRTCIQQCEGLLKSGMVGGRPDPYAHVVPTFLSGVCLHIAHRCNLRCEYCYADAGRFGREGLMRPEVARKAIDFAMARAEKGGELDVGFFGGEPLINLNGLRDAVCYARQRAEALGIKLSFSLTSNATLLKGEAMDLLGRENFSLIFSLDGPAHIHDRMRKTAAGGGTHAVALRNVKRFRRLYGDRFTARGTFTRTTPDFMEQVLFLNAQGFRSVSVEPAQLDPKDPNAIVTEADILRVKLEYDRLAEVYVERFRQGRPLHFFHFEHPLRALLWPKPNHTQCGAGAGYVAVTPDGRLFPCFETVMEEENCIGDLDRGFKTRRRRCFQCMHADARKGCRPCWLRHHCGGGCHAFNIRYNRDIHVPYRPYCEFAKHRFKLAAWILSEISAQGEKAVRTLESLVKA